jgi:hypothetical protein
MVNLFVGTKPITVLKRGKALEGNEGLGMLMQLASPRSPHSKLGIDPGKGEVFLSK